MVVASVLAVGALGIGIASGQTSGATYTGCLRTTGKIVKVAVGDAPLDPCIGPAVQVSWGEVGPQGPQGEDGEIGPRGIPGPRGQQGPAGVLGFYTRTVNINKSLDDDEQTVGTATCDTGDVATGGGFHSFTGSLSDAQASVLDNRPEGENGWYVAVANLDAGQSVAVYADVYVRCADVTP